MAAENVSITIEDPDLLIAGASPLAEFVVVYAQLYRFSSEVLARDGVTANSVASGTLVETFTLIAASSAWTNTDGPFRFATYDSGQTADSWYVYRFANSGLSQFSQLSEPWQSDNRDTISLRNLLYEIGAFFGHDIVRGTATAGAVDSVTCTALFASSIASADFYKGNWLMVTQDAGGSSAAPEGEEAMIASVNTSTGVATLDRDLTQAVANNDVFLVSAFIPPSEMIRAVNRVRERMEVIVTLDLALSRTEWRYQAPQGIRNVTDVIDCMGVIQYSNTNREEEFPVDFQVLQDGTRTWLTFPNSSANLDLVRLRYIRSYRDLEGNLSGLGNVTAAPLPWLRAAAAAEIAHWLVREDPEVEEFGRLLQEAEVAARQMSALYAPKFERVIRPSRRQSSLPGPQRVI